jgi:hypothetical protein
MPRSLSPLRTVLPRWWHGCTGNLAQARARFEQAFGFAHDDQQVDEVIADLFRRHCKEPDSKVPIPAHLVLALTLRAGFERGVLKEDLVRKSLIMQRVYEARELAEKLLPKHRTWTRQLANDKAAEKIAERYGDVTKEQLLAHWYGRRWRSRARA